MGLTGRPERVLVLGGTGLLGSAIARAFSDAGCNVLALARNPPGGRVASLLGSSELVLGSIETGVVLRQALLTIDHVVHAVGCPFPAESTHDPLGDLMQTVPGLLGLLDRLRMMPDVRFTFLSSGGTVYGNPSTLPVPETLPCRPLTPYGVTKVVAETYVGLYSQLYGIDARVLRVANAYGEVQSAARGQGLVAAVLSAAVSGAPVALFGDGAVRDYVDVRDVARAVVGLSSCAGGPQVVNVGSGVGHSVSEVVEMVERVTGRTVRVVKEAPRPFDVREIVLDVAVLKGLVEWEPVPLEVGIERIWEARAHASAADGALA